MRANYEDSIEFKMWNEDQKSFVRRLVEAQRTHDEYVTESTEKGITIKHTYPVVDLVELEADGSEEPVRLVKLATAHGATSQWSGAWSRDSTLWTDVLKAQHLGNLAATEFFMPFPEYIKLFRSTTVDLD